MGRTADIAHSTRRAHRSAIALAITVLAAGCIGSVDRDEFDRLVQDRGGGLSQDLVIEALDAAAAEIGADPLLVRSVTATNETVTIEAVNPDFPDELDRYTYRGDDLDGPDPVNTGAAGVELPTFSIPDLPEGIDLPDDLQELVDGAAGNVPSVAATGVFAPGDVALDKLNAMVDRAIEAAGLRGGYASNLNIGIATGNRPTVRVNVTNDRRTVTTLFGPTRRLLEQP